MEDEARARGNAVNLGDVHEEEDAPVGRCLLGE